MTQKTFALSLLVCINNKSKENLLELL